MATAIATTDDTAGHPRATADLTGHEHAERAVLDAFTAGRLHHAWLITGPRGVGKATLAYRIAHFLLSQPADTGPSLFDAPEPAADSLAVPPESPVFQRVAAGSHGNLLTVERGWDDKRKVVRQEIVVDDVRRLHGFFGRTAAEGGWRVAVVDSADEMNRNAANALLKLLEEPPARSVLLLVAHAPGRLLPTIRSRCRRLDLKPLPDRAVADLVNRRMPDLAADDVALLAGLSDGAPGRALSLAAAGGLELYRTLVGTLVRLPELDTPAAHALAGRLAGRGSDAAYRTFLALTRDWVGRFTRALAAGEQPRALVADEAPAIDRLAAAASLDRWVEVWEKMGRLAAEADAVNLDRKQTVLATLFELRSAAAGRSG